MVSNTLRIDAGHAWDVKSAVLRVFFIAALAALSGEATQVLAQRLHLATVTVRATSAYGTRPFQWSVDSFTDAHGADFSTRFNNGIAIGIPYGTYRIVATEFGATPYLGTVDVAGPAILINVAFEWYGAEGDGIQNYALQGTLSG